MPTVKNHPRLYIGSREKTRIRMEFTIPLLRRAAEKTKEDADKFCLSGVFEYPQNTHNEHLVRARYLQNRIVTLLVQWIRTDNLKYRDAVVIHLREMSKWEYWSWITWRSGDPTPDAIWDLSYGENATTLAIAWDLLYPTLILEEKEMILGIVRKWVVPSFLKHTAPSTEAWWVKSYKSNWLAVCACGGGMVALAMSEELPEAKIMLERANSCMVNFMNSLVVTGGGWPEGVAYWNYGMRYAFLFLLSYEKTTGETHSSLELPETIETLRFPPVFTPHGKGCGYGDISDHTWQPIALHFAVAERLGATDVLQSLDSQTFEKIEDSWATAAELLAFHPEQESKKTSVENASVIKLYDGMFWGYFADSMPTPSLYVSIRGGTSGENHNIADLLSWHCLVNKERLISSVSNREYIDSTFSDRRFELPEIRPDTKNSILIGGVGMSHPGVVKTSVMKFFGHSGFYLDATLAFRSNKTEALFIGRAFIFIDSKYVLVLDHISIKHTNRLETRLHSYAQIKSNENGAALIGEVEKANIVFASTVPSIVATSMTTPTNVSEKPANILRWAAKDLHNEAVFGTLLIPGIETGVMTIKKVGLGIEVNVQIGKKQYQLKFDNQLHGI